MTARQSLRKRVAFAIIPLTVILVGLAAYVAFRPLPRTPMERYVPANALGYIEITSISDLLDGLTETKVWQELGDLLGLSSQIAQLGPAANLMGRTGLGPDEAVVAGRGQFAIAFTGLEAESGDAEEGPYIHFKPRFAIVADTHTNAETTARLARQTASILAHRLYGNTARQEAEQYEGIELVIYRSQSGERQLVAAATGTLAVLANHEEAIKACLDTIAGRSANLSQDPVLKAHRGVVDNGATVFGFVTGHGAAMLSQLGPALFAGKFTTDSDRISSVAGLFGHMSKQTIGGLLYGAHFDSERVVDKYLTVLTPEVGPQVAEALKAAPAPAPDWQRFIPAEAMDVTIINVEGIGELPERVLKGLAPRLDVVAGLALREFVIGVRRQFGLEPSDSLNGAIGDQMVLVRFDEREPVAMILRVMDRAELLPALGRYLRADGSSLTQLQHRNVDIAVSSHNDERAAAFIGEYLALATKAQLERLIDAYYSDLPARDSYALMIGRGSIASYRPSPDEAAEAMLAISAALRVTDGSQALLQSDAAKTAIAKLPASISFTEFREYGVYTETRSALGNFGLIGSVAERETGE